MKMRPLGRTGLKVSPYCLGTMMFGPATDLEETLSALTDLITAGKVRAIGSSSFLASDIVEGQWISERRRLARLRTEQPSYSILARGIERDILPVCDRYGMGVLTWSPLAWGLLSGKYRAGQNTPVSPGTDVGVSEVSFVPQSLSETTLRRRAPGDRTAE